MIHIDRAAVPKPELFESERYRMFWEEIVSFNLEGGTRGTQSYMDWEGPLLQYAREVMESLQTLFNGKCAYTERYVGTHMRDPFSKSAYEEEVALVLHRPASDAVGIEGDASPDHYWWLIAHWENWYLAHPSLRYAKSNTFPVAGPRMHIPEGPEEAFKPWKEVNLDMGYLLDPCMDEPGFYLEFDEKGVVSGRDYAGKNGLDEIQYEEMQRAEQTIRILDLNASGLVEDRQRVLKEYKEFQPATPGNLFLEQFEKEFLDPRQPFLQFRRQLIARSIVTNIDTVHKELVEWATEALPIQMVAECMSKRVYLTEENKHMLAPAVMQLQQHMPILSSYEVFQTVFGFEEEAAGAFPEPDDSGVTTTPDFALSVEVPDVVEVPAPSAEPQKKRAAEKQEKGPLVVDREAKLLKVSIKNFKAIKDAEFEISNQVHIFAPRIGEPETLNIEALSWKVFLGENGSGKSCMLEAIGMALSGADLEEVMEKAELSWKKILRRSHDPTEKITQGSVRLEFTRGIKVDLRFNKNRHWWVGGVPELQGYVRGYGATRLLDSGNTNPSELEKNIRITNLYDPRAPVIDAKNWLLALAEGDFNVVAIVLDELLGNSPLQQSPADEKVITRSEEDVFVRGDPLELVSDGYRAVIAIACDIMAGLGTGLSSMRDAAQGIVLIDEIGAHLHPRWRMSITETLRRALPKVQFLVSTHEPLCLRGLRENEVIRVHKTLEEGVILEEIDRSPSAYRVDQLLTSEFFGMDTTIDPELEARFQAYYRLLAMPEAERPENYEAIVKEQKDYIDANSNTILGTTRRDQLVYEVLDQYLAHKDSDNSNGQAMTRDEAMKKITDIWDMGKFAARRS